tara:strand:- start:167 stop:1084 length:918 start_codon:yes stop_codon:yes gene_type:complete
MKIEKLLSCDRDALNVNETLYIERFDSVHPRGYNMRCGSEAGRCPVVGTALSTFVSPEADTFTVYEKGLIEGDVSAMLGMDTVTLPWDEPVHGLKVEIGLPEREIELPNRLTAAVWMRDDTFPMDHLGIRFNTDKTMVDAMDAFTYLAPRYDTAKKIEIRCTEGLELHYRTWDGSRPYRKRRVLATEDMMVALAKLDNSSKKTAAVSHAALLLSKITQFKNADEQMDTTPLQPPSQLLQEDVVEYGDCGTQLDDERASKKRLLDDERASKKRRLEMDEIMHKIEAFKKLGDMDAVERLKTTLLEL